MSKLIYHLCLICGCQQFIDVDEYNQGLIDDDVSGTIYGCVTCDYAFSIDGTIDQNNKDLFDEDVIKNWTKEDWQKQKETYLNANPKDADMLQYQQAVTKSFAKFYKYKGDLEDV